MSEAIDRYNVKIDYVGGEPIVSMQKQNHGPYVSYDEYASACLSLGKLVSSSEAERYRVCGELLNRTEAAEARLSEAVKVLEMAENDLRSFMTSFVREHFPDNTEWRPFPDLLAMLTQMDNASTIARTYRDRAERAEAKLVEIESGKITSRQRA